jgi:hypothetical protein
VVGDAGLGIADDDLRMSRVQRRRRVPTQGYNERDTTRRRDYLVAPAADRRDPRPPDLPVSLGIGTASAPAAGAAREKMR